MPETTFDNIRLCMLKEAVRERGTMKKNNRSLIVILLLFLFCFTWATPAYVAGKAPYKIGVNLEMTGPWGEVNKIVRNTLLMEVEKINGTGGIGGRPLQLLIEDNGFDLNRAAANMTKFSRDKEVIAVIGPFEDNFQATTRAIAEREKITNIIICPSNPKVRALKQKWSFNIAQNDIIVSEKLVDLCLARNYKKILVFPAQIPLAQSLADYFKQFGEAKGMKVIVSKETHLNTDIDMTPQLIKLKPILEQEKVDAFYACTGGPPGGVICKNIRSLGIKTPILGTHAFGFGFFISLGGEATEGVEFPAGKPVVNPEQLDEGDPVRPVITDLNNRLKARYGTGADQISGHAYDAIGLLHASLKRSGDKATRSQLRDSLENTKGFPGCMGIYNYSPTNHDGLTKKDLIFIRIEGQKFTRVKFPGFE
jgi:branched-chain amino acid transport system substrate-binding protein